MRNQYPAMFVGDAILDLGAAFVERVGNVGVVAASGVRLHGLMQLAGRW